MRKKKNFIRRWIVGFGATVKGFPCLQILCSRSSCQNLPSSVKVFFFTKKGPDHGK